MLDTATLETMDACVLALLVGGDGGGADSVRNALADSALHFYRLQTIRQVPTALARIAGGGVGVVLLDISESGTAGLDSLRDFRAVAPEIPVIVLYGPGLYRPESENATDRAMHAGAAGCLEIARCQTDLTEMVSSALEHSQATRASGKTIAFMGAKGGVGTTTVGLNVASALARNTSPSRNTVIFAELRSQVGSLAQYCQPQRQLRNIGHLLKLKPRAIGIKEVESCLWPFDTPQLKLVFGPQDMQHLHEIGSEHARSISTAVNLLADYAIFDLATSLAEPNRTVIESCDCLVLVVERDPLCVQMAKLTLQAIGTWDATPPFIGAVVVNRSPVGSPMDIAEVETQLAVPIVGSIPPAADTCVFAQKARLPLIELEPDGLAATSLMAVAHELKRRLPIAKPVQSAVLPPAGRARSAGSGISRN